MSEMQDRRWMQRYEEVLAFVKAHKRFPSRHHAEDYSLMNWMKYNRKMINKGKLCEERTRLINELRTLRSQLDSSTEEDLD